MNNSSGYSNTKLFKRWCQIKARCFTKTSTSYERYGAKGITMCDEWKNDFKSFEKWAYENGYDEYLPSTECTLDRIDNSKGYSPDNCRWVTSKDQANNQTTNVILSYNGKSQTISQWADEIGIDKRILYARRKLGWSDEDIITTPPKSYITYYTYKGHTYTKHQWCKILGVSHNTIEKAIEKYNGDVEKAFSSIKPHYTLIKKMPYNGDNVSITDIENIYNFERGKLLKELTKGLSLYESISKLEKENEKSKNAIYFVENNKITLAE